MTVLIAFVCTIFHQPLSHALIIDDHTSWAVASQIASG